MRVSSRILRSGVLAVLLVFVMAASTLAYYNQNRWTVTVTAGSAVVWCDQDINLTATVVRNSDHSRVVGATVHWTIMWAKSSHDELDRTTSFTNSHGKTFNTLSFGHRTGNRVVKATAGGVNGTTTVRCKVRPFRFR